MTITVSHLGRVLIDKGLRKPKTQQLRFTRSAAAAISEEVLQSNCSQDRALSAALASESDALLTEMENSGKIPKNIPAPLREKMEESLNRYFADISSDKISQYLDKATQVVQDEIKTYEETRPEGKVAETGLNPATGRSALTSFIEDSLGEDIGAKMGMDFFLRIAREVAQGGVQFVAQNWDQTRVDEFPALEFHRVYEREVPRGSEKDPAGPENAWDDDEGRWLAAAEESGDEDAAKVFEDTGRCVALKSSDIWQSLGDGAGGYEDTLGNPFAPFAFNSGWDTDEVARDEAVELGLMDEGDEAEGADVDFDELFDLPKDLEARYAASVAHRVLFAEDAGHTFHGNQWTGAVYHGTNDTFENFDEKKAGSTTDEGFLGRGVYVSTDPNIGRSNAITMKRNLHIENPLPLKYPKWETDKRKLVRDALGLEKGATAQDVTDAAKKKGYDSVMLDYSPVGYHHKEIVVFDAAKLNKKQTQAHRAAHHRAALEAGAASSKRGCLMAMLPDDLAEELIQWGKANIPADDLDPKEGMEMEKHVTVLYGFDTDFDTSRLAPLLTKPIAMTLGKITRFRCPDKGYDVLKVDIESPDAEALNAAIKKAFMDDGVTPSGYDYHAHCTLAYIKPDHCTNLDGSDASSGRKVTVNELLYSLPNAQGRVVLPLSQDASESCTQAALGAATLLVTEDNRMNKTVKWTQLQAEDTGHIFHGNQWTKTGTGISLKRSGEGKEAKWVTDKGETIPEHAAKLGIPPAWTNVKVAPGPDHDLQAVGYDAKGREQRIYSDAFTQRSADAKFSRITELMGKREKIFAQNERNLLSSEPQVRENAACMKLIQQTGIRPGSDRDTGAEKDAYGATTLQGRHVTSDKDGNVRLQFVGKKGVNLDIPVDDKATAHMLLARKAAAGDSGKLFDTDDAKLRDYSHTLNGGAFKPKDFRTLKGTETARGEVEAMPAPKTFKEYKAAVMSVAKKVASKLGNTPVISLQSYISPHVFSGWREAVGA
jgi:DNA topoisomerase-1